MVGELAALRVSLSSTAESVLGCLPDEIFHIEVMGELGSKFQRLEEWFLWLQRVATKIWTCSLGHHPVGPDWPTVWMRSSNSLGQSRLHSGRQMLSWR
jgi:hypothetical protein